MVELHTNLFALQSSVEFLEAKKVKKKNEPQVSFDHRKKLDRLWNH